MRIFYDTETCGFHGLALQIQYAKENGPVIQHQVFSEPIDKTLNLIEFFMENELIGFNIAFDHFHLCKLYTILSLLPHDEKPEDLIDEIVEAEPEGRAGLCLKPKASCDLLLHARKTRLQEAMERDPIYIRKVPNTLAYLLADYLDEHLPFEDYLFARQKVPGRWKVEEIKNKKKEVIHPEFKHVVCRFAPSSSLKNLARQVLNEDPIMFQDIMVDDAYQPLELGYAPFAKAIMALDEWPKKKTPEKFHLPYRGTWPLYIQQHKIHWTLRKPMEYARNDVILTRKLYEYFGCPDSDTDSELACSVAAVRWRGFDVDIPKLEDLRREARQEVKEEFIAPTKATKLLEAAMDDITKILYEDLGGGSNKTVLKELAKWDPHPVADLANQIMHSRTNNDRAKLYTKLITAGRFHASSNIIGTKTGRMSGNNGLNSTGINRVKKVRECFTMGEPLEGGDFNAFELSIADAVYKDKSLNEMLVTNRKVHAEFGALLFKKTYQEIIDSEGSENDLYNPSKSGFFALMYGGQGYTLHTRLGVPVKDADEAVSQFLQKHPEIKAERDRLTAIFSPVQENGWVEPTRYVESLFGFKRDLNLEFDVCRFFYEFHIPWTIEGYCQRGERTQSYNNALQSAFRGAIYTIQNGVVRAAINHQIQSTGAGITKMVQRAIWDLQPTGIHPWHVQPLNIHDEILCVHDLGTRVKEVVDAKISELRSVVPLLKMNWTGGKNWAEVH